MVKLLFVDSFPATLYSYNAKRIIIVPFCDNKISRMQDHVNDVLDEDTPYVYVLVCKNQYGVVSSDEHLSL